VNKRAIAAAAALCGLLLLVWWFRSTPLATEPRADIVRVDAETRAMAPRQEAIASSAAQRPPQPSTAAREDSLRGTDVDGGVRLDANGRLVADRELRRLFDYFLARLGERSPEQIRADLLAWLQTQPQLDATARAEVTRLFDRYVELQRASAALGRSSDLRADLQRLRELRERELGVELARTWFGEEQEYAEQTLARLALASDASLDAQTRAQRLAELDRQLDPQQRAAREASTDFQLAVAQSEQLAATDASAQQRAQQRRELWGDEAAVRLAELDQQEASWQLRLRAYAQAREQLFADRSLAPPQREIRLARLLSDFSEAERRRVLTLAEEGLLPH
jgi:lipase chaperone LimK